MCNSPYHTILQRIVLPSKVFILLIIPVAIAYELPHGVPHTRAAFYRVGKPFFCLDGSSSIPWTKVNDNYCDCADGSDEPGTTACQRGIFYCKDTQYKLKAIPTAFVKDGYCDCCDGSDEYGSRVSCESNCGTLAAADQHAKSIKRNEIEEGHKLFKKHAEQLKIENAKREQERAAAEEAARLAPKNETEPEIITTPQHDTEVPPTTTVAADSQSEQPSTEPVYDKEEEDLAKDDVLADYELSKDADHQSEDEEHEPPSDEKPEPEPEPMDYGPEGVFQVLDNMDKCLEFSHQQYTYELCGLKEVFQREGSGNKISLGKWAGWGHSDDSQPSGTKYDVMLFKNGLTCWNGPARSTKVFVHCGTNNEILNVAEPSRCEYVMNLRTFAACFEDPDVMFKRLHPEE